jgi:hypothetical protein
MLAERELAIEESADISHISSRSAAVHLLIAELS